MAENNNNNLDTDEVEHSVSKSEFIGQLGAEELAGVVIEHSNENNELVVFAHNPRLLEQFRGKQVEVLIRVSL